MTSLVDNSSHFHIIARIIFSFQSHTTISYEVSYVQNRATSQSRIFCLLALLAFNHSGQFSFFDVFAKMSHDRGNLHGRPLMLFCSPSTFQRNQKKTKKSMKTNSTFKLDKPSHRLHQKMFLYRCNISIVFFTSSPHFDYYPTAISRILTHHLTFLNVHVRAHVLPNQPKWACYYSFW